MGNYDSMTSIGDALKDLMDRMPEKYKARIAAAAASTPRERVQHRCDTYNADTGDLDKVDGYNCDLCKNKGFIAHMKVTTNTDGEEIDWRDVYAECRCKKARAAINRLKRSGLGDLVKDCRFEKYNTENEWQRKVKSAAMAFVNDDASNMFFFGGSNGCGKTTLCTAIAAHYLRHGSEVVYMSWKDDVAQLNACVNDAEEYERQISRYKETEVLYIDDFLKIIKDRDGKFTRPTEGEINRAYEIINYRYRNPRFITIISSERYMQEIIEVDEATGSRIYERTKNGYCFNIKRDPKNNYRLKGMNVMG